MSTTATNNLAQKISGRRGIPFPVDQTGTYAFNQGDLVYFDTSALVLKALDSDAHAQYLAGVALVSSNLVLYANSQSQAVQNNYEPMAAVGAGDIFNFTGVAGQTYTSHGTAVYYATDAQHVTASAASHIIGYVWNPQAVTLVGAVTIPVLVVAQYPVAYM